MGISITQLLIILFIVLILFGSKKLRNIGQDIGGAVKGFRDSMGDSKDESAAPQDKPQLDKQETRRVIDAEVTHKESSKDKL